MNNKIDSKHLNGLACVYIRQSTMSQVRNHTESRRRQMGLVGIAEQLGWPTGQVMIIDDDQGKSGTNTADRPGYQQLLGMIVEGRMGMVLAVEVSRLARDDVAWQQMVRHCAFTDVLLADETHIYDPKDAHDRMMLGMLGTLAEYELSTLRRRMQQSYQQKAARGELYGACPPGYVVESDHLIKTADKRVCHVLDTLFSQFDNMPSINALSRWCWDHNLEVPISASPRGGKVFWRTPTPLRLASILHNPCYAGAYVFGRRPTVKELGPDGQIRSKRKRVAAIDCKVVIKDHHSPYIGWEQFERNQNRIERNNPKRMSAVGNTPRKGAALLSSLLFCGDCGYCLSVRYSSNKRFRYICRHGGKQLEGRIVTCQSVPGPELDQLIVSLLFEVISPVAVEAAIEAQTILLQQRQQHRHVLQHSLEQAEYEAERAFRQYDRVDPENRLVADQLEQRWNLALKARAKAEEHILTFDQDTSQQLADEEREQLLHLGEHFDEVWFDPHTAVETKKQIIQLLIERITMKPEKPEGSWQTTVHWAGGCLTKHQFAPQKKTAMVQQKPNLTTTVSTLRRIAEDWSIAQILNRCRITTNDGGTWTEKRVHAFRRRHSIAEFCEKEKQREGDLTGEEAAEQLQISPMSVHRLIRAKILPAEQSAPSLPCVIRLIDVQNPAVQQAATRIRQNKRSGAAIPVDPRQLVLWTTTEENTDD